MNLTGIKLRCFLNYPLAIALQSHIEIRYRVSEETYPGNKKSDRLRSLFLK